MFWWLASVALAEPDTGELPVAPPLELSAMPHQVRHAVVVGANNGGGVIAPLLYAERDAEKMSEVLVELGGFDEQMVTVLYGPTAEDLRVALANQAAIAAQYPDDLFLFYYSGHADAQGLRLGDDHYYFETLKSDLHQIDSTVRIGVLDACRSGTITRLKGATVGASILDSVAPAEGEAWLTASAAEEDAQESDELRGGFFTHYLMSGMRGAADVDDGVVDLQELYSYTFDRVVVQTGDTDAGPQHPSFDFRIAGAGSIAVTDVNKASAKVLFPADLEGRISVLKMPDGTQLAELQKPAGRTAEIAVPPGRYLFRRWTGGDLYEVSLGVNDGAVLTVGGDWGNPRLPTATTSRGVGGALEAGWQAYHDKSRQLELDLHLGSSPVIAGVASSLLPGAGQVYNHQIFKGLVYLGATSAFLSGFVLDPTNRYDPTGYGSPILPTLGLALWGASIADGIYNVHRNETERPVGGVQLGYAAMVGGSEEYPYHLGASADVVLFDGVSVGLDGVGYTQYGLNRYDIAAGSRLMWGVEGSNKFRPGVFGAFGVRYGRDHQESVTRFVGAPGVDLRYYVVPRYFVELEGRYEFGALWQGPVFGLGLGTHLGR
jgi:uncharacterized caspase-like protein